MTTAVSMPTGRKVLCAVYGLISVAAMAGTWSQFGPYLHSVTGVFGPFWVDTKATAASRFVAVDVLLFALAGSILMVIEARKHDVKLVWAYVIGAALVGISVVFPLFLIARELRMHESEPPQLRAVDVILLSVFAVVAVGLSLWIDVG